MSDVIRLYHGSKGGLVGSIAPTSRDCCDFGRGFYLGDSPAQPLTLVCHHENPMFYVCELDLPGLQVFDFASRHEWALYIAFCRGKCERFAGTKLYERIAHLGDGCDILKGKIANDRMFMVLNDFFDGAITDKAMIASLECLNLGTQYCCKTGEACQRVTIVDSREVGRSECESIRIRFDNQRQRAIELTEGVYKQYRRDGYFFDEFFEKFADGVLPPCS